MTTGAASDAIVVSGLGVVSPCGAGWESLAQALRDGTVAPLSAVESPSRRRGGARCAALVEPGELQPLLPPGAARRMSPPSRFAVAAARLALLDAGLGEDVADERTAVFLATGYGAASYSERLLRQMFEQGPGAASPMLFTESVANAAAAQVALLFRLRGSNVTVTQRDAGCLQAVALGAREIRLGRAERALVGGVDEVSPVLHDVLARFGVLATGDPERARPFDRRRNGLVVGEGAVVAVLERELSVRARGGRAGARLRAFGSAFDPSAPATSFGSENERLGGLLRSSLRRAGAGGISMVVSAASGSRAGDRAEAGWLRAAFGPALPAPLAPKAHTGDLAAIPFAAAVLACRGARFGPTPGFTELDPDLCVAPYGGAGPSNAEPAGARRVLVDGMAAGGAVSWLLLEEAA